MGRSKRIRLTIRVQNLAGCAECSGCCGKCPLAETCPWWELPCKPKIHPHGLHWTQHTVRPENPASDGKRRSTSQTQIILEIRQLQYLLLHSEIRILWISSFSCIEQSKEIRFRANILFHVLTPWSSASQTSNSTSPAAQAKPSWSSLPPLSLTPTVQFLSKSCQHYHQNISRTQPISTAIGLLDDCSSFLSLLAPALQYAQLGSWCGPCTRSSQMMSLRSKSKLLPLTYQTSCYFSGHFIPYHPISCSFHSSHCSHLTVPQIHRTHFYLRTFAHSIPFPWNDFHPKM